MGWYDLFSRFYDKSLEPLYRDARAAATEALQLAPGHVVLDVPCGTGLGFDGIVPAIGEDGVLVGLDRSTGMLAQARKRVAAAGWGNVVLEASDVHAVDAAVLSELAGRPLAFDRLHVFLGLTAFDRWEEAFARLWARLAPGGRCVVVDVHAERPGFQGHLVNLIARADIRRRFWQPLAAAAEGFELVELPRKRSYGGALLLASGRKPA